MTCASSGFWSEAAATLRRKVGSLLYVAPEVFSRKYGTKVLLQRRLLFRSNLRGQTERGPHGPQKSHPPSLEFGLGEPWNDPPKVQDGPSARWCS